MTTKLDPRAQARPIALVLIATSILGCSPSSTRDSTPPASTGAAPAIEPHAPTEAATENEPPAVSPPEASATSSVDPAGAKSPPAAEPEVEAPPDTVSVTDPTAVDQWLAAQARVAQRGETVKVRIPVAVRGDDWGCICPRFYVGDSASSNAGTKNWVHLLGNTKKLARARNAVFLVTGRLMGTTRVEDLRGPRKEAKELIYEPWDLHVESAKRVQEGTDLRLERLE